MIKNKEWIMKEIKQHLWETEGESYTGYEAGIDFVKALIEEADQQLDETMTEIKKVVIPQFVAKFLDDHADGKSPTNWDKADLIINQEQYIKDYGTIKLKDWIVQADNFILFVEAIVNGYEVEKEKLYYVALPYLGFMTNSFDFPLTKVKEDGAKSTEQEIKSIDKRYWAFAVEVEEVDNDR